MGYLILILAVFLASFLGWLVLGPVNASARSPDAPRVVFVLGTEAPPADRSALTNRLEKIAGEPASRDLERGAMCYDTAAPPEHAQYRCPKCKEQTLYALPGDDAIDLSRVVHVLNVELPSCRRLLKEVKGLKVELDESQFCRKCHPKVKEPQLGLVVRDPKAAEPHRVWGVTVDDLRLIVEFTNGKTRHVDAMGRETAMKDHLKRLEELLGVKTSQ